jgi:peptide/nickel transport system ATP-binding protein
VREAHKHNDPRLEPVAGDPGHSVACLLASDTRRSLWKALADGAKPAEARKEIGLPADEAPAATGEEAAG